MPRLIRNCYCMIDVNKILQADVLDLIFEGRNKEYGAYELRTNYRKRLMVGIGGMVLSCACIVVLNSFANRPGEKAQLPVIADIELTRAPDKEKPIEPPPVEPPRKQEPVKQIKFNTPLITNQPVKPEDIPPLNEEVENAKIGNINVDGRDADDVVAPPIDTKETGVIEKPEKKNDDDEIRLTVQIESEYPGGISAWLRFLTKNLPKYYTDDLVERGVQGRVIVQFVVDKEGNVSNVQGIEGPAELRTIAETVIRKSGKWTPAIQEGRQVKSYKRQPVIFALPDPE
jgi:periplasmic protein TonB